MKKILLLFLVCFLVSHLGFSQVYNPSLHTTTNKSIGFGQATPGDARSMYFDQNNFVYRAYASTSEVLSYLSLPKYRYGNFIIVIDSAGTLQGNGVWINGINTFWMFKDGTADANLVELNFTGSAAAGGGTVTNVSATGVPGLTWSVTNPTTTPNITPSFVFGGDVSGTNPGNLLVTQFNGLLPAYYLNYNNLSNTPTIPAQLNLTGAGTVSVSGSYPNLVVTGSGGGVGTAGYGIKFTSGGTVVNIDSANYRKVDSIYTVNDSTFNVVLNGRTYVQQVRGGAHGGGAGTGSVTNFSFVNANGVSGSVTNPTSIPALTLTLGAITPTSVNGLTLAAQTAGFTISGGTTSKTLTVPLNASVSNTNTGDITLAGENYLSLSGQVLTANPINLSGTNVTGVLKSTAFPALTGDVTTSAGSVATTISANVVTNAKLAQMPANTIKGNNTGSTANALDLTATQVTAMLNTFTTTLKGLVPAPATVTGKFLRDDGTWATGSGGGTGNTNSNVGSAYRWAIPGTNNIKTFSNTFGTKLDSLTANQIGISVDSTIFQVKGYDTLYFRNPGGGIDLAYTGGGDTIYVKSIQAGANITLTQNADSSITISATGSGSGGITSVGTLDSQPPSANGGTISGSTLTFQSASNTAPGLVTNSAQTIGGVKTFAAGPIFSSLNVNGGVLYDNAIGQVQQTGLGTATTVLHGGTNPAYGSVALTTDVSGVLPVANGGNGTATPSLQAGTNITITGLWPNQLISSTGGGATSLTRQVITAGGVQQILATNSVVVVDPSTTLSAMLLNLPTAPVDNQIIYVDFGGQILSGYVVSSFVLLPQSGAALTGNPTTQPKAGSYFSVRWRSATSQWYVEAGNVQVPPAFGDPYVSRYVTPDSANLVMVHASGIQDSTLYLGGVFAGGTGGTTPTWQQTLSSAGGSVLGTTNTIDMTGLGAGNGWSIYWQGQTNSVFQVQFEVDALGLQTARKSITANYTATNNDDEIFVSAASGNVTITLPVYSITNYTKSYHITRVDASGNTVTIAGTGGGTILNGNTLTGQYANKTFVNAPNGADYYAR